MFGKLTWEAGDLTLLLVPTDRPGVAPHRAFGALARRHQRDRVRIRLEQPARLGVPDGLQKLRPGGR